MRKKKARRDTYNYVLKEKRKIRGFGITNRPERRVKEHKRLGKRFTHMVVSPYPVSRSTARRREKQSIRSYRRSHVGKSPRYNKQT